ncbi:GNAT family N-acetyltransferase [Streptomyces sp. NPDC059853]|uniref:GNAT family N-acetyltransferase n=1 Tax=Streptomyces sp. NPDC059853 TaxID=3346973 RepID=UPI00365D392A
MKNSEIRTLLGLHHGFLLSTFCTERRTTAHGDLVLSDLITDPYYNYFCPDGDGDGGSTRAGLAALTGTWRERARRPALYTTPLSPAAADGPAGFAPHARDSWMLREAGPPGTGGTPGVGVRSVGREQRDAFLAAFSAAYSSEDAVELYGPLEESHVRALARSFDTSGPEDAKFHLLAVSGGRAVGVAVVLVSGSYAGVYAVGTVAGARRRGVGRALLDACADRASGAGATSLFLQVEAGTGVEQWYRTLGYRHAFHGTCYVSTAPR